MAKRSTESAVSVQPDSGGSPIPDELLLRRDHNIRYERNGAIYATDGRVGFLKQVVVDDASDEVVELVIRVDNSDRVILLPTDLVDKTAGSAIFLNINQVQFVERAAGAPSFERKKFGRVDALALLKELAPERPRTPGRSIIGADRDYVETPIGNPLGRLDRRSGGDAGARRQSPLGVARMTASSGRGVGGGRVNFS